MVRSAIRVEPELLEQADLIVRRAQQDPRQPFVPTRAADRPREQQPLAVPSRDTGTLVGSDRALPGPIGRDGQIDRGRALLVDGRRVGFPERSLPVTGDGWNFTGR